MFAEQVKPALTGRGIEILRWKELTGDERKALTELFRKSVYPVLTPLVVDPAHPFPFISGLSLNLAVTLVDPTAGISMFARVKVPPSLPRFVKVGQYRFVPIEDVIAAHLDQLFGGMDIVERYVFRITRVRELEVDEDVTENLLQAMERELAKRRFEPAVRLEVEQDMSNDVLRRLARELSVDENAVYRVPGPLDLSGLNEIADLPIAELKYPPFVPNPKAVPTEPPSSTPSTSGTCSCITPTTRSPPPCSGWSRRPPPTRGCWRSSRRCTGPAASRRSWTR